MDPIIIGGWTTINIPIYPDNGDDPLLCPYRRSNIDGGSKTPFSDVVVQVPAEPTKEGFIFAGWELFNLSTSTGYFFKAEEIITTQSGYIDGNLFKVSNVWGSDQGPNGDGAVSIFDGYYIKAKWIQPLLVVDGNSINATDYAYIDHGTNKEVKKIIYKTSQGDPGTKIVDTNTYYTLLGKVTSIDHTSATNQATIVTTYSNQVPMYKRFGLSIPHSLTKNLYGQTFVVDYAKFELVPGNEYLAIKNNIHFPYDAVPPSNITAVAAKSYPVSQVRTAVSNWTSQPLQITYETEVIRPDLLKFEYSNYVNTNRTKYDLFHQTYNGTEKIRKGLKLSVYYTSTRINVETFKIKFRYSFKANATRSPAGVSFARVSFLCTNNSYSTHTSLTHSSGEQTYTGVFSASISKSATTSPIIININCYDHDGYPDPNVTISDLYISPIAIVEQ